MLRIEEKLTMRRVRRSIHAVILLALVSALAHGETRKEFRYTVGHVTLSVINQYGPIVVKPAPGNQIIVVAVLHSDKVEIDQAQNRNRVDIHSHLLPGATADSGQVDYDIQIPAGVSVVLRSANGRLRAEGLRGDVTLESPNAAIEVADINHSHVRVKTMTGPVRLLNIRDAHVEVTSVSGDVVLNAVNGPQVRVNESSGHINYDGDFGYGGEYRFSSNSGDIEASAPESASMEVEAHSEKGRVVNDFQLEPKHTSFVVKAGSAFAGTMNKAASSVRLFSISGKIHLKKR
ncbi:MAG: hypothetical protein DMG90_16640 [Acidobacteria bacterium]|jgi:hypothetical protein|nr:MAG: hypothetical protein DMG91_02075 [Acidobacteriota bacterium]PYV87826.1 MAG: hypothetical protein DMG90_16640 [Acidobacteriota bacterium]